VADQSDTYNRAVPATEDNPFYKINFNTPLSATEEKGYNAFVPTFSNLIGRDVGMDEHTYDTRGWWKSGQWEGARPGLHGPDTWKKPNHPSFSNESIYHGAPMPKGGTFQGGSWDQNPLMPDRFTPSPQQTALNPDVSAEHLLMWLKNMRGR